MSEPASNPTTHHSGDPQANEAGDSVVRERLTVTAEVTAINPPIAPLRHPIHLQLPELSEDPDAASVVQLALAAAVETFLDHDEAAAHGDVRGIHQARVGLRRFRSHLRTFRRVIDNEWASALSVEASWLADYLGAVRDLDVLNGRLVQGAMLQVPEHAPAIAGLVGILEEERDVALDSLRDVRETARFDGLVGRLVEAAQQVPSRGRGEEPAEFMMPKLLQRSWNELRAAVDKVRRHPTEENLHTVRIRAKRMRYASEASIPVLGADAKTTAKASEALQERLGEWHDAFSAREWLHRTSTARPDLASVAIRLGVVEKKAGETAVKSWESDFREIKKSWKKIDPKRHRST